MQEQIHDLNMAKKRNRKIFITDEAIAKVPKISYKEIPEKHYDVIQELAKQVLIASRDKNNCNEVAVTYSLDSEKLVEQGKQYVSISYGDEHSVDPCSDTESNHLIVSTVKCIVIVLHNHPSLSKISLQDVQFLLQYHSIKMIVAITNLGKISYLVKTDQYSFENAYELFREAVYKVDRADDLKSYKKGTDYFLNHCNKTGLIYEY